MRWPLRNQILLRIFLLLLVTVGAIIWLLIQNRVSSSREAEEKKLQQITAMLGGFPFPKSASVLKAMKNLSGAEFVVRSENGEVLAYTSEAPQAVPPSDTQAPVRITEGERIWYHTSTWDRLGSGETGRSMVSVFLPVESESQIFWRVGRTPLLVAALALPLAMILGWLFSNQITRPLISLCQQTNKLASGEPIEDSFSARDDEIGDLYGTMNQMAQRIGDNENRLRRSERLSTLVEVGNGIAHNIGNSAAGCQMALELMASGKKDVEQAEEYRVAMRQLDLMKSYIKRFLSLSKQTQTTTSVPQHSIELKPLFEQTIELLEPMARHLEVRLDVGEVAPCPVLVDEDDARQIFLNLIINAIRAAKQRSVKPGESQAAVKTKLVVDKGRPTFTVEDTGAGPPEEIAERIFEPFVSSGGTGLGLAMVKGIAEESGGSVSWRREEDLTIFQFVFKPA